MKSFAILRTNVGLTTNVKITIDSNYDLSLNSIDSNYILSSNRYKKFKFNKNSYYDEVLTSFFKGTPAELAYQIRYNNDVDIMSSDFSNQYDEIYNYGARNIIENKNYQEEYEYFAPLYIKPNNIPSNFIIFRVDGPGIESINKENFKLSLLNKFKTVKVFNLNESKIGEWLDKNFKSNKYFPDSPLEIDFRNLEFSKWNGIDYEYGGYSSKSLFLENIFENEKEIYELEKFIFDNYKNSKIVFPNIINFSFLFDDVVSTPDVKRSWSLNRYFGFYINSMDLERTIAPHITPKLREDVIIKEGNILFSESSINNPFLEEWSESKSFHIEYGGQYYLVRRYSETRGEEIGPVEDVDFINEQYKNIIYYYYKIISDLDLQGKESLININYGFVDADGYLKNGLNSYLNISNFDEASVWLIKIDDVYHNIQKDSNNRFKINSDYSFTFTEKYYEYKVRSITKRVELSVDSSNNFKIFKINFTDIKDFDTKIIDTDYSRYEYEKKEELTDTDEPKIYLENILSNTNPKEIDDYFFKNEVVNIPVSSEYTANYETFKIDNNELSDIWRINSVYCRWGLQGSLSFQDKPYLLNNSLLFEDFNKCANPLETNPIRSERNLDYFYSINSSTSSYINHSLHIERLNEHGDIDEDFNFEIESYLNTNDYTEDYFNYFFERSMYFDNSLFKKNVRKYSYFNKGDSSIPNLTFFKGLEFKIFNVSSFVINSTNQIESINVSNDNEFEDYKFSILLTENRNGMTWSIVEQWRTDTSYKLGDLVIFDDILYIANSDTITVSPSATTNHDDPSEVKSAPYTSFDWNTYDNEILWSPDKLYNDSSIGTASIVYNNNTYYYCKNDESNQDFWDPYRSFYKELESYDVGDIVLYKGNYYMSMTSSNRLVPNSDVNKTKSREFTSKTLTNNYWKITKPTSPKWYEIEIWNPSKQYVSGANNESYVVHNDIVYRASLEFSNIEIGEEPGISILWNRIYSLEPDNDYIYKNDDNSIIFMNNRYYVLIDNPNNESLDNGIDIYINKKWKNVLIKIYFNDGTIPNIKNSNRDDLYTDVHSLLTAYNFTRSINDISNKFGFINYVNYIIIDENGSINNYNYENNIRNLSHLISCEWPEILQVKVDSLDKKYLKTDIKPSLKLNNGVIDKISKINWYNNIPIAYEIIENDRRPKVFKNYSSNKNIEYLQIQRFNGYYMPIFYDIELFDKNIENKKEGNYLFDTTLSEFALMKERKIRKINRKESILKLRDSKTDKSIYPMIDEYGYTYIDFMIFKSTWDFEYYKETVKNKERLVKKSESYNQIPESIGQPILIQFDNSKKYKL